ncbi:MAG TPA: TonB-dependent receptor, partial [Verrucomicrobiae bacterium]|nr:TonB-dependent receptor [Verrucomicrobiae bacterium]
YKGPGFNQTAVSNPTQDQVVGPEIPTSYELGLKTSFFEGAITANFAVFHTEFEDYQAQVVDFDVTPAAFRTVNAGSLESQGFEADITAILPPGILLSAAVTYLDANYGEFAPISCYTGQTPAQGCDILVDPGFPPFLPPTYAYDPSGQPLAGVAEWKTSFGAYYERELSAELNGFVQADYSWRSDVNASSAGDPRTRIDAYGLLGASIGVKAEDDSWRFSIWGRNLTDERFPSSLFNTVFGGAGDYSYVPTADAVQRVGVSLSFRH